MTRPAAACAALLAFVGAMASAAAWATAPVEVSVPRLDRRDDAPLSLPGFWFPADGSSTPAPAPSATTTGPATCPGACATTPRW